jgi:hypothetical protein
MDPDSTRAKHKARRAYELGRLRYAARAGVLVAPMTGLAWVANERPLLALTTGVLLCLLVIGYGWRGGVLARAIAPGLLAGSAPLVLPLLLRAAGHCCVGGACVPVCMLGCVVGGVCAGVALGLAATAERAQCWAFLAAASVLAGFAGVLGCAIVGLAGIVGMVTAVIVTSLPVVAVARAR